MKHILEILDNNYITYEQAILALDNYRWHKKGQPIIVLYKKDDNLKSLLAVGVKSSLLSDTEFCGKNCYTLIGEPPKINNTTDNTNNIQMSADNIITNQIDYSGLFVDNISSFGFLQKDIVNSFGTINYIPAGVSIQEVLEALLQGITQDTKPSFKINDIINNNNNFNIFITDLNYGRINKYYGKENITNILIEYTFNEENYFIAINNTYYNNFNDSFIQPIKFDIPFENIPIDNENIIFRISISNSSGTTINTKEYEYEPLNRYNITFELGEHALILPEGSLPTSIIARPNTQIEIPYSRGIIPEEGSTEFNNKWYVLPIPEEETTIYTEGQLELFNYNRNIICYPKIEGYEVKFRNVNMTDDWQNVFKYSMHNKPYRVKNIIEFPLNSEWFFRVDKISNSYNETLIRIPLNKTLHKVFIYLDAIDNCVINGNRYEYRLPPIGNSWFAINKISRINSTIKDKETGEIIPNPYYDSNYKIYSIYIPEISSANMEMAFAIS